MKCFKIFLAFAILLTFYSISLADIPNLINFQGILDSAGNPLANKTKSVEFKIYDDSVSGNVWWSETQSVTTNAGGVFNVILGSSNPIPDSVFDDTTRYLAMKVETDSEMNPRQRITSIAYSFRIASTPWTPFPFAAGYNNYTDVHGGTYQTVQYRKIGDIVYIRGLAHKADHVPIPALALLGSLPVGFRPPAVLRILTGGVILSGTNATAVVVQPSGDVLSIGSPTENQFLDGIIFSTSP